MTRRYRQDADGTTLMVRAPVRTYMSWGGGVQSTTLSELVIRRDPRLLAVLDGPLPELFLFADTGDEPRRVYDHVAKHRQRIEDSGLAYVECAHHWAPLWSHVIERAESGVGSISSPPVYVPRAKRAGMMPTQRGCTYTFKARALDKAARQYFGVKRADKYWLQKNHPIHQWYGMSYDEGGRMRDSEDLWRTFKYPLIDMKWTRQDCKDYLASLDIVAPRSACYFCPFRSDAGWQWIKQDTEDWAQVVEFERRLQAAHDKHGSIAGLKGRPYLHASGVPIDEVEFSKDEQGNWSDDCQGVCGV